MLGLVCGGQALPHNLEPQLPYPSASGNQSGHGADPPPGTPSSDSTYTGAAVAARPPLTQSPAAPSEHSVPRQALAGTVHRPLNRSRRSFHYAQAFIFHKIPTFILRSPGQGCRLLGASRDPEYVHKPSRTLQPVSEQHHAAISRMSDKVCKIGFIFRPIRAVPFSHSLSRASS